MLQPFDFSELVGAVAILVVLGFVIERRRIRIQGPLLVLREFRLQASCTGGDLITIRGRSAGLLAYLLTFCHLDDTTSFVVTEREIRVETSSLHGVSLEYVPMMAVSSSECTYFRSFFVLIAAFGLFTLASLAFLYTFFTSSDSDYGRQVALDHLRGFLWAGLSIGVVLYVVYALSKRILISVETSGGRSLGVAFKRSVIENISIELHQARAAVALLNRTLLAVHEGQRLGPKEER
jgi:hypothetical protein